MSGSGVLELLCRQTDCIDATYPDLLFAVWSLLSSPSLACTLNRIEVAVCLAGREVGLEWRAGPARRNRGNLSAAVEMRAAKNTLVS